MAIDQKMQRRDFLKHTGHAVLGGSAALAFPQTCRSAEAADDRPNIILIMTDDQGYGDLGCHGNDKIRTPNLDHFASESIEMSQFCVSPVCAPTRSSLMTGRYNYRTGVVDTYLGRAMMHSDETTLAEMLSKAGYRTGIFGKWHLGDNYPLRSIDNGFQESLVHNGGGIGQPADPPGNKYQDPILQHNGEAKQYKGYCTDIFTDAAIEFIQKNKKRPFFVYLSTNAPHTPLQIDEKYYKPYLDMGLDETTAKVYGMIENIDDNIGRLMKKLDRLRLSKNTLVIFLTDNGPQQERYVAGFRNRKGSVYEGGIHVPCYIRWTGTFQAGKQVDRMAAHIDIVPTVLEICGAQADTNHKIDGKSLLPLLKGDKPNWPDRTLFFQWHRGDEPILFKQCAARSQRYKMVNGDELYDLQNDPGESTNIAAENPEILAKLRKEYDDWFADVSSTRGYAPPRIQLGTPYENPVILTRQDWRGPEAGWGKDSLGYWEVEIMTPGTYEIRFRFLPLAEDARAELQLASAAGVLKLPKGSTDCTFSGLRLEPDEARLEAKLILSEKTIGVNYVDVIKTD